MSAAERTFATTLRDVANGARRELSSTVSSFGFLGGMLVMMWLAVRWMFWRLSLANRIAFEQHAVSPLWREKNTAVVPMYLDDHTSRSRLLRLLGSRDLAELEKLD
jgi:hypothetical protein